MTAMKKDIQGEIPEEEVAALSSLSFAAEIVEASAYALAGTRPGKELTHLFLLAADLENEIQRISGARQS